IAHGIDFAIVIAHHQIWIHLSYFFGDQAKLRRALAVALVLEGHWFKSQNSFAGLIHRFYLLLKSLRGGRGLGAESAGTVDIDRLDRPALAHVINTGDEGAILRALPADANFARLARHTKGADIDVVTAGG